jgi:hypothetical protein
MDSAFVFIQAILLRVGRDHSVFSPGIPDTCFVSFLQIASPVFCACIFA